ncbi:MAG: malto-oligosyltrehalose synthase [Chloroflexi bacterium]|nr:MAG: malto-oligosyltrehalose synthase [Chloroflexota bacterium]
MSETVEVLSTYRLQLNRDFGFEAAAGVVDYLDRLGVTHLYSSPYLQAAPGSLHGYDVVDPTRVNDELGGPAGFDRLVRRLRASGLGQVLDVVPNHMATGPQNAWWWDLLEHGPSSRYALYFDVAWDPPEPKLRGRILLPVLADHYGRVLENGELRLERQGPELRVRYFEQRFPVAARALAQVLRAIPRGAASADLEAVAAGLHALPELEPDDLDGAEDRLKALAALRRRLAALLRRRRDVAQALDETVAAVNADPERLDAILELQRYRLARWQTAAWDMDYRRFFDITSLAGLRVSDPRVFEHTHRLILAWLQSRVLDGVRVDHPDGLRDPHGYFERLRQTAPRAWIVAEKILQPDERLPEDWPVDGTTGYDAMFRTTGLFIDPQGERPLTELYQELTGEREAFAEVAYRCRHAVMRDLLGSDVRRLVALLSSVCERHRRYRDFTRRELEQALREVIACFPVYRSYVRASTAPTEADRAAIDAALGTAARRVPHLDPDLLAFLRRLLLLELRGGEEEEFTARFQQLTGPVTAKAIEDTAFYRFNRLLALNEVGGDPGRFGVSVDEYHRTNAQTQQGWPATMVASSTHDTKRSEDVRARLALLSEIPSLWAEAVRRWMKGNARHRRGPFPDRNIEYLLYQTLVGAHPIGEERLRAYMEKAAREAKCHTSWIEPDREYEQALRTFVEALCRDRDFQEQLAAFVEPLVEPGWRNSLGIKLLTLTAPGVPDVYQGTELWSLALVDPDNRRPVDFEERRRLLAVLETLSPEAIMARAGEGLPKLLVVARALGLRRQRPASFGRAGGYEPLWADGDDAGSVVAFARGDDVITVVPRLNLGLRGGFRGTALTLPPGEWRNVLSGEAGWAGRVRLQDLLARFPVALLARDG